MCAYKAFLTEELVTLFTVSCSISCSTVVTDNLLITYFYIRLWTSLRFSRWNTTGKPPGPASDNTVELRQLEQEIFFWVAGLTYVLFILVLLNQTHWQYQSHLLILYSRARCRLVYNPEWKQQFFMYRVGRSRDGEDTAPNTNLALYP